MENKVQMTKNGKNQIDFGFIYTAPILFSLFFGGLLSAIIAIFNKNFGRRDFFIVFLVFLILSMLYEYREEKNRVKRANEELGIK